MKWVTIKFSMKCFLHVLIVYAWKLSSVQIQTPNLILGNSYYYSSNALVKAIEETSSD